MSQEKEAHMKFYKTREDKELDKVIALENKVKVLDDIVYKTGQSVQTMNMFNHNCKTSFAKPEFLKKAQRANPRLYDIGCYNDNLALMLAPESDEMIRLAKESRSKLSDLIRPFDYHQLNNLYDLFVPQREKSHEQQYFSKESKMSHTSTNNEIFKDSFNKQTILLEKRMDESIPWDQKCKSSKELFKIKRSVDTIFDGVERCKQTIAKRTYFGHIDPFIQTTIEGNFCPQIRRINADLEKFQLCLKEEMVADLRYFNSLEHEVDSLKSQLDTQKHITNLQCDYLETLEKCESLEKEISKSRTMSKSFKALQKHAINLELDLQQYLKAQLQDKGTAISELKKLIDKMKGKAVETKFEKSSIIQQLNAFKRMYKVHTEPNQTRTPQMPQDTRKTNKRVSFSTGVIPTTSVSRPQLKSNRMRDSVMPNNSQGKKQEVEEHRSRGTDLYSITLQETCTPNPICLLAKATSSQAWLWHRRLSHLNFDTTNLLLKINIVTSLLKLKFFKDHLCSSCELGKAKRKSFHTKTTPSSKRRLQLLHMDLCGPIRVESINGKKYVLVIVDDYSRYTWTHFLRSKDETPAVLIDFLTLVQRGLHVQVRTVRTDKGTKFLNKTLHAYFAKEDGENLDKMKEKGDASIFVGYSTQSRAYRVFNKRTRIIVETIHVNFDELPQMASDHGILLKNVPQAAETVTMSNELDLLFSPMFDELLNGTTSVVSKSSAVHTDDAHTTPSTSIIVAADSPPLNIQTTPVTKSQEPTQVQTVSANKNIIQAETNKENAQVDDDEFINVFSTPVQERGDTSSHYVDSLNMHTFYQHHPSEHRWTKDHPLEQVIRNPS
ncbi:retrovirus-related pol polyprotein from transposon TNT 1-94 [Tanacetum coccineum]